MIGAQRIVLRLDAQRLVLATDGLGPFVVVGNGRAMTRRIAARGFTLIEVLVGVAIVAVTLGAGHQAAGALTNNAQRLGEVTAAQWCADNQLTGLRLSTKQFPSVGDSDFGCEQLGRATASRRDAADAEPELPAHRCAGLQRRGRAGADALDRARALLSMKAQRGFTLVEVLVALLVLSIMAAMAWQGVDGIVRARDASQRQLRARRCACRTVLAQWRRTSTRWDTGAVRHRLVFDGAPAHDARHATDGVQVVAWSLKPGERQRQWRRWASRSATTARRAAGQLVRQPAGDGQRAGPAAHRRVACRSGRSSSSRATPGATRSRPATSPPPPYRRGQRRTVARQGASGRRARGAQLRASGGMVGTLTRDIMLGP